MVRSRPAPNASTGHHNRLVLTDSPDPADGVRAFVEAAAHVLRDSGYVFECPVAPIVLDSPESSALAEVCQEALEEWQQVLVEGIPLARG